MVRPGRPGDAHAAAALALSAAAGEYARLAGGAARALAVLRQVWARPGHSASYEHALVAEIDDRVVGLLVAFPVRERYRLHARLLIACLPELRPLRRPVLAIALPLLVLASPRPPRRAYYVQTIAVAPHARRRGVAFALGRHAELAAAAGGFPAIVAHTGTRHAVARGALEEYGLELVRARPIGYALYAKAIRD